MQVKKLIGVNFACFILKVNTNTYLKHIGGYFFLYITVKMVNVINQK